MALVGLRAESETAPGEGNLLSDLARLQQDYQSIAIYFLVY